LNVAERRECRIARPSTGKERDTPKSMFTRRNLSNKGRGKMSGTLEVPDVCVVDHFIGQFRIFIPYWEYRL